MRLRMKPPKRWTKTQAFRWSAKQNAQRGDPSNPAVPAFKTDRMRAYYRGRRPGCIVVRQMMRRWIDQDLRAWSRTE